MTARLTRIQAELGGVRRRLEDLARRLGAVREWATAGDTPAPVAEAAPPARLFGLGDGALDDVDLHFEVLDTEDPGRNR
ncbi:MAG TPA: hypothetical protein VHJ20_20095 [Polyangia bacterium]|nr:hypothetical protein [Polyangia bacterium]